jgi:hypothetical protein
MTTSKSFSPSSAKLASKRRDPIELRDLAKMEKRKQFTEAHVALEAAAIAKYP